MPDHNDMPEDPSMSPDYAHDRERRGDQVTTSNVERMREIVARMRAAVPQSTNNVWTVFESREQCKAFFEAQSALLEIAEQLEEVACAEPQDIAGIKYVEVQIDRETWAKAKAALAKFNSLKIEGL